MSDIFSFRESIPYSQLIEKVQMQLKLYVIRRIRGTFCVNILEHFLGGAKVLKMAETEGFEPSIRLLAV